MSILKTRISSPDLVKLKHDKYPWHRDVLVIKNQLSHFFLYLTSLYGSIDVWQYSLWNNFSWYIFLTFYTWWAWGLGSQIVRRCVGKIHKWLWTLCAKVHRSYHPRVVYLHINIIWMHMKRDRLTITRVCESNQWVAL